MKFDRRTFLRNTGLTLLSLGLLEARVERYQRTLAQTTNRKLALLVGINSYPENLSLSGCLTDVELQRELLIHRFGFSDRDILVLTEQQATRENIETAFNEHLNRQAQADDVVVFHFSGYGDRVKIPTTSKQLKSNSENSTYKLVNSLMPADSILEIDDRTIANQILEDTLMLLTRSLATDKLTTILDTSYINSSQSLLGNLRLRSWKTIGEQINPEELAFSEQLRLNLASRKSFGHAIAARTIQTPITQRDMSLKPSGMLLTAAGEGEIAAETSWDNFDAGLFTYALTQYLWQVTPASKIQVAIARSSESIELLTAKKQQPVLIGETKPLFAYYLIPENPVGAEGVISKIDEKGIVRVKLLGLPGTVLKYYGNSSCLQVIPNLPIVTDSAIVTEPITLQLQSREGLMAKTQLLSSDSDRQQLLKVGQLVRENVRVLPHQLNLSVVLDANLGRIERVDATSAFSGLKFVSAVADLGTQAADCLLSRIVQPAASNAIDSNSTNTETKTGYGLLSVVGVPIANTIGSSNEAVKSAIGRLTPQLKTLLAAKLWRMTANEGSSRLPVSVTLESISSQEQKSQILGQKKTLRSLVKPELVSSKNELVLDASLPKISSGDSPYETLRDRLQIRVENLSDRPVYVMLFGLDVNSQAFAYFSPNPDNQSNLQSMAIAAQTTSIFSNLLNSLSLNASNSSGLVEIYAICSIAPFFQTFTALSTQPNLKFDREQIVSLLDPLEVTRSLLKDLHAASIPLNEKFSFASGYALNTNAWATLGFACQLRGIKG
ncbi:MAG: caspase family protein [Xenococcaceae cyanobacterium]